ncbi:MAG TPA: hypothetical protein VMU67_17770 [Steroidobacteraceae bacterium]|nr:hypothetical protein [Steroidobacteraceae bacterium]
MTAPRAHHLARRLELLELEAEVQRVALAARLAQFEQLEQRRPLAWLAGNGYKLLRTIVSNPRLRWLLVAAVLRRLGRRTRS